MTDDERMTEESVSVMKQAFADAKMLHTLTDVMGLSPARAALAFIVLTAVHDVEHKKKTISLKDAEESTINLYRTCVKIIHRAKVSL